MDGQDKDSLFDLCKEVYKRFPEWHNDESGKCIWNDSIVDVNDNNTVWARESKYINYAPLYTSDYLLEKLLKKCSIELYMRSDGEAIDLIWNIKPQDNNLISSDTPLKALLKLTIALLDAGELHE